MSFVIQLLCLVLWFAGEVQAEAAQSRVIDMAEDDGGVRFASAEPPELAHRQFGGRVGGGADGEGDKDLVRMQAGVLVAEMPGFQILDRLNDNGGDEMDLVLDAAKDL